MRVDIIKEKLEKILLDYEIEIFSIKTKREFGEKILEILLKGKNLNSDLLAEIHHKLYENLEDGDMDDDHFLEISSLGAEYLLNNINEIKDHVGTYVAIEGENLKAIGTIFSVEENIITLEYNNKGQFRKLKIEYDKISKIETRVKL